MNFSGTFEGVGVDKSDPVAWNKAWDKYLETKFRPLLRYPDLSFLTPHAQMLLSQDNLAPIEQRRKELVQLQYDLAKLVRDKREDNNFDSQWRSMSPETRRDHILQGLLAACTATVDTEERRQWCPETRMQYLEKDKGNGFLNLLTRLCPKGIEPTLRATPILVANETFESMFYIGKPLLPGENEAVREVIQRSTSYTRNFFLTFFLWCTMLHVYGLEQRYGAAKPSTSMKEHLGRTKQVAKDFLPREANKALRQGAREGYMTAQHHCANCSKPQSELGGTGNFLQCSKCKTIGRKILYCNRDCQVNDWKNGNPPHKKVCGKQLELPEGGLESTPVSTSSQDQNDDRGFPNPAPGYVRSPELVKQLSLLEANPNFAYVLTQPDPKPDHGVVFTDPMGEMFFHIMLRRAVVNGDPGSVALMAQQLEPSAAQSGISRARLLTQLSKEYGVPVSQLDEILKDRARQGIQQDTEKVDKLAEMLGEKLKGR